MNEKKIQIIRRIAQVLSFFFFTSIFTLAFSGFQQIYMLTLKHNFSFSKIQMFIIPLTIMVVLTIFFGRFFCGWFCAFGALNDFLFAVPGRLFKKNRLRIPLTADSLLKYLKYALLFAIVILVWSLNIIPAQQLDPWLAFAQIGDGFKNGFSWAFIILFLIGIGAMFIERFFCRYLCPLGAILALLSKIKLMAIHKPETLCRQCRLCSATCPMGIDLHAATTVNSGECISCLKCVSVCPRKNAEVSVFMKSFNSMTYVFSALILFMLINFSNKWVPSLTETTFRSNFHAGSGSVLAAAKTLTSKTMTVTNPTISKVAKTSRIYRDGVYEGEAQGIHPGLKVSVTVKDDKIMDIRILDEHESPGFKEEPLRVIPQAIIKAQSTTVDAVSGATFTSRGIINAVQNALNKANS
jgi:NosR/NirI family transcriptional regulator, nitrous oxide reductase regulator